MVKINKNNKHIFLVILFGTIEFDGRVKKMIEILSSLGEVLLVDNKLYGIQNKESPGFKFKIKRFSVEISPKSNKIIRHVRHWLMAWRVARLYRPDVVVSEDFFTIFPGFIASCIAKSSFIYDAHELIIPEDGDPLKLRDKFWYFLERLSIKHANLVLAANPERAQLMSEHYSLSEVPSYMRNIPSAEAGIHTIYRPEKTINNIFTEIFNINSNNKFILYQGYISIDRGLLRFIEALNFLPDYYTFLVVGGGPDLEYIKGESIDLIEKKRLFFVGPVPNEKLSSITSLADIGIVTYPYRGLNNIYCAPNKVFEYLQAGLPVIATNQPALQALLREYKIGFLVEENDSPEIIAQMIITLLHKKAFFSGDISKCLADYNWQNERSRVKHKINQVLNCRTSE